MSTTLLLATAAVSVFFGTLFGYFFCTYRKTRLLNRLAGILDGFQGDPRTLREIQFPAKGDAAVFIRSLNRFVLSMKQNYETMSASCSHVRASDSVIAYNKKKFEGILDAFSDGILVADMSGNVILANRSAEVHLGMEREKILGKPVNSSEWLEPQDWARLSSRSGDKYVDIQKIGTHMTRTMRVSLSPFDSSDAHSGEVVLIKDVTDQALADQARGEFVAHVAHELKAPLNTLKSYTEMLMDGEAGDEETKREFYNTINEEADRLAGLIGNLLNITKIDMGSLQVHRNRLKTREFIENLFQKAESQKKGKRIIMNLLLPDTLPAIKADKDLLSVALLNLLSNAIKYTDEGATVSLKAEEVEDLLMIHVIDSGIGIPESDLPHIFDKFYRSEDKRARERSGHGLGLALAKQIVHLHDGDIQVISHPGEGSQFTMILKKEEDILE